MGLARQLLSVNSGGNCAISGGTFHLHSQEAAFLMPSKALGAGDAGEPGQAEGQGSSPRPAGPGQRNRKAKSSKPVANISPILGERTPQQLAGCWEQMRQPDKVKSFAKTGCFCGVRNTDFSQMSQPWLPGESDCKQLLPHAGIGAGGEF